MADTKISALTSATTPLAGTEVLPIVQSSTTKKVAVSDLTAGRDVAVASLAVGGLTPSTWATYKAIQVGPNAAAAFVAGNGADSWFGDSAYYNSGWKYAYSGIAVTAYRQSSGVHYWYSAPSGTSGSALTWTLDWSLNTGNFVQGTAAKGINFTANSAAAGMTSQLLNWYEEGNWTPTQGAGLTVVGTFSSDGQYTRIGRQVTVKGRLIGSTSVAAAAASIMCGGLPYSSNGQPFVGSVMNNPGLNASGTVATSGTNLYSTAMAASATLVFTVTYFV